jgi:hypothetical protein
MEVTERMRNVVNRQFSMNWQNVEIFGTAPLQ